MTPDKIDRHPSPPAWLETASNIASATLEQFDELSALAGLSRESDFRFADLTGVDYAMSNLSGFDFTGARLSGCSFVGALITGAVFDQAELGHISSRENIADLTRAQDYDDFTRNWKPSVNAPTDLSHMPEGAIYFFLPNLARIRGTGSASDDQFYAAAKSSIGTTTQPDNKDSFVRTDLPKDVKKASANAKRRSTLPRYLTYLPKGFSQLQLIREVAVFDESIVDNVLTRLVSAMPHYSPTNDSAQQGDRLVISGQSFVKNDVEWTIIENGKFEKSGIILGSQTTLPGLEEALLGAVSGTVKLVNLVFPESYRKPELAGRPALLEVRVIRVERRKNKVLDDDFARELGFDSLAALREKLRSAAERDLLTASKQRLKRQLLDKLDEQNKFEAPVQMVNNEQEALWDAQLEELALKNLTVEALGKSVDDAKAELRPLAERRVRLALVISQLSILAAQEGFTVTDDDIEKAAATYMQSRDGGVDDPEVDIAGDDPREMVRGPLLEDAVIEWLLSKAEISTRTVSASDLLEELK